MKISVFGMGYVGIVSSACLARDGHYVVGVDPNQVKVDIVNSARTPIMEESMADMVESAVAAELLSATSDAERAVMDTEISFVCVGTPSCTNGDLDLTHVQSVCRDIGGALKTKTEYHASEGKNCE